jgi:hypothetical protein
MKLAEALILRADRKKRIEQLRQRLISNAKVQEGDNPAEDPAALLSETETTIAEFADVIRQINRSNVATELEPGVSLADAIVQRDSLKWRHEIYRQLAQAAVVTQERRTQSEIKFKGTVVVADLQRQADDFAKQHRELDARIQQANWLTELQ